MRRMQAGCTPIELKAAEKAKESKTKLHEKISELKLKAQSNKDKLSELKTEFRNFRTKNKENALVVEYNQAKKAKKLTPELVQQLCTQFQKEKATAKAGRGEGGGRNQATTAWGRPGCR